MKNSAVRVLFKYSIALVWIINGLYCKILGFVPRHEQIVSSILGTEYSSSITLIIGVSEIGMAIWFLSGVKAKLNTWAQISIVAIMNILEYSLVPDLLLWGRYNVVFAVLFIGLVYYNYSYSHRRV